MLIDGTKECDLLYNKIYEKLKFKPSSYYRGHSMTKNLPFELVGNYAVYGIENMTESQIDSMEEIIREVFVSVVSEGKRMYAMDWQHSTFLFDPRDKEEYKGSWKKDDKYLGEGYNAIFLRFIRTVITIFLLMSFLNLGIWDIHGDRKYGCLEKR